MTRTELLEFLRRHRLAVEATLAGPGVQAAVVGIAVTDNFEIIFDTLETTRKSPNLARDPRIAFVIGGIADGEEVTVQYEGMADRPAGEELRICQEFYLKVFPDGTEPGIRVVSGELGVLQPLSRVPA